MLGPLLFLVFIGDLRNNLDPEVANILKYVDDSKILGFVKTVEDVNKLQIQLEYIYKWADANNMAWNKLKFQILRIGLDEKLKEDTKLLAPDKKLVIERKIIIKDLGILVDEKMKYSDHIQKAISKARQKIGWISRTFKNRSIKILKTLWNSLVQSHMDYGSILWTPVINITEIMAAEGQALSEILPKWPMNVKT